MIVVFPVTVELDPDQRVAYVRAKENNVDHGWVRVIADDWARPGQVSQDPLAEKRYDLARGYLDLERQLAEAKAAA